MTMTDSSSPSLAALLSERAAARPDAVAVDDGATRLTYGELAARAHGLARRIAALEGPVGILLPMSADYIVAILAALFADTPYVPMDDSFPPARNLRIVSQSGMSAVIVKAGTVQAMNALDPSVRRIVMTEEADDGAVALPRSADPARVITIFYTSGSTGEPKGVCHSEIGLILDGQYFVEQFGVTADDCHSLMFSPSVSISNRDIFGTLLAGARLSIVDMKRIGIGGALAALDAQDVTILHTVPSAFRALFGSDHPGAAAVAAKTRLLRLNGDRLLPRDVELYKRVFPRASRLCHDLATTETRPYASWLIDHDTVLTRPLVPVGYPRDDLHVALVDESGAAVADGETGEIVVASPVLSLGYWREPTLTQSKFTPSARLPGMIEYRTGDFGRLLPDGLLEFIGRRDRQIKVRGNTMHLSEIEAVISGCAGVRDACVVARREGAEVRLIAYCQATDGQEAAIRDWCRQYLAGPMRPAEIVVLDTLPLLPTGKIDLIEMERRDAERARQNTPAVTQIGTDDALAMAWSECLGRSSFANDLTFEEAGGDSLQAMSLMLVLERRLGRALPNGMIDWGTRPSGMAAKLAALNHAPPLEPGEARKPTLLLFPGIYGADFASVALARRLSDDFRVVLMDYRVAGTQMIGPADREQPFRDTDARLEEEGTPARLWLLGYSFGCRVAAEAARRLVERGVAVEFLGLIDGPTDAGIAARNARNAEYGPARPPLAKRIAQDGGVFGYLSARVASEVAQRMVNRGYYPMMRRMVRQLSRWKLRAAANQMMRVAVGRSRTRTFKHLPTGSVPMAAMLFTSSASYSEARRNQDLGWGAMCTSLEIVPLEGDHNEIVSEERSGTLVDKLAAIERSLRPAQAA